MNKRDKSRLAGVTGALLVHVAIALLLLLVGFSLPEPQEEGGMPVILGDVAQAFGPSARQELVPVDVLPQTAPQDSEEQELLTQDEEETVAIKPHAAEQPPQETEPTEAEKAEQARLQAEAQRERDRKQAEEAARRTVAGAFGKGAQMGNQGTDAGQGSAGSPTGNAPDGAPDGEGGYGTFSLGGRSIGEGGLPRPTYQVQEEGKVVVDITVSPDGQVIATAINRQTNTVSQALRQAAEEAAKKAKFNAVSGQTNQTGTITYYFKLK